MDGRDIRLNREARLASATDRPPSCTTGSASWPGTVGSRGRTPSAGSFGALIITGVLAVVFLTVPTVAILVALLVLLVVEWERTRSSC
jgi:hypothetical protein